MTIKKDLIKVDKVFVKKMLSFDFDRISECLKKYRGKVAKIIYKGFLEWAYFRQDVDTCLKIVGSKEVVSCINKYKGNVALALASLFASTYRDEKKSTFLIKSYKNLAKKLNSEKVYQLINKYKQRDVIGHILVCLYRIILTKNNLKVAVDCIGKYRGRVAFEIAYRLGWISLKRKRRNFELDAKELGSKEVVSCINKYKGSIAELIARKLTIVAYFKGDVKKAAKELGSKEVVSCINKYKGESAEKIASGLSEINFLVGNIKLIANLIKEYNEKKALIITERLLKIFENYRKKPCFDSTKNTELAIRKVLINLKK